MNRFQNEILQEEYIRIEHESGLPIYIFPKDFSSTYAIMATKYGSLQTAFRFEDEEEFIPVPDGVAHFLEHKMFEEEDGSDAFDKFAPFGASANAYTSFDTTAYLFSTTGSISEPLRVLLSFVTHPHFTKENVEKEQGIIGQEIDMCEDRPGTRLYYEAMGALYGKHPISHSICGTKASISEITPDILYRCYEAFYRYSNMALCIVGRADPEEVARIADEILPKKSDRKVVSLPLTRGTEIASQRVTLPMAVSEPLFMIGVKDTGAPLSGEALTRRGTVTEIVNDILFSASSPLHARLYDSGLILGDLSAGYEYGEGYAHNLISGMGKDPEAVYREVLRYLEEVKETPFSEEDFLRTKRAAYAGEICFFDKTEDIGNAFIDDLFHGSDIFDSFKRTASVTYEEAVALLRELFRPENIILAVITPKGKGTHE